MSSAQTVSVFHGGARIAGGELGAVISDLTAQGLDPRRLLVFNDDNGRPVPLNTAEDIAAASGGRGAQAPASGKPVDLSVRLLPRHATWLSEQPGGPSAAVRRLIDAARRDGAGQVRRAKDAAYAFIAMLAGDLEGYEEACRALFAGDSVRFRQAAGAWPKDVRDYACELAGAAFAAPDGDRTA